MKKTLTSLLMAGVATAAQAEMVTQPVAYDIDGEPYQGMLVYDGSVSDSRPGLLMVPNWMGVTEQAADKAYRVAGSEYVVFIADMYGKDIRPQDADEAGKAASFVRDDRARQRQRVNAALEVFKEQTDQVALDTSKMAAIGFCFGGGTVLELARSGTEIGGVVSFHGNLDTPNADDAQAIKTSVLVLHGADDPYVPPEQVQAFEAEMRAAEVDWQLTSYGGAVHSFTDPTAAMPGQAEYHPLVAERAFAAMHLFLRERLAE
ncbi:dienelactone hydrolase family protein [Halopseudomonas salegens]|uniref:Dienelactone hydrolase n=1 Tax=Halopseudomonas salegens TaxID=1434072 RepID=A0A1H2FPX2_9GAMM|nr:dienelactone hydrolase family protein [Halopseudomonas salegens]SDU09421.1 Dienelactone hydrolase [Halopseudomonas salegens]